MARSPTFVVLPLSSFSATRFTWSCTRISTELQSTALSASTATAAAALLPWARLHLSQPLPPPTDSHAVWIWTSEKANTFRNCSRFYFFFFCLRAAAFLYFWCLLIKLLRLGRQRLLMRFKVAAAALVDFDPIKNMMMPRLDFSVHLTCVHWPRIRFDLFQSYLLYSQAKSKTNNMNGENWRQMADSWCSFSGMRKRDRIGIVHWEKSVKEFISYHTAYVCISRISLYE